MNVLLYLSAPILAIALLGCNAPTATSTEQAPKAVAQADIQLDFSTPDKSLKTFWQIRDRIREQERVLYSEDQPKRKEFQDGLRRATTVDVFQTLSAGLSPVDKFERDILEVKVESESRAVVTVRIRNTTPIPAGAEVSKYEEAPRVRIVVASIEHPRGRR
jgi:hypothetical protein